MIVSELMLMSIEHLLINQQQKKITQNITADIYFLMQEHEADNPGLVGYNLENGDVYVEK